MIFWVLKNFLTKKKKVAHFFGDSNHINQVKIYSFHEAYFTEPSTLHFKVIHVQQFKVHTNL
jgi:hypothetical protein